MNIFSCEKEILNLDTSYMYISIRYLTRELHRNVGSFKRPLSEDEFDGNASLPLISTDADTGRICLPQNKFPVSTFLWYTGKNKGK